MKRIQMIQHDDNLLGFKGFNLRILPHRYDPGLTGRHLNGVNIPSTDQKIKEQNVIIFTYVPDRTIFLFVYFRWAV